MKTSSQCLINHFFRNSCCMSKNGSINIKETAAVSTVIIFCAIMCSCATLCSIYSKHITAQFLQVPGQMFSHSRCHPYNHNDSNFDSM